MATSEAIHCIGCVKDISETEESLCPIPLANQLKDSKLCLDGSFSSGSNCSNHLAIDTGNQKGVGEEHSKNSFHTPLEGWQKHPPRKERHDNFNCKLFSMSYSSYLSANEAEPEYPPQTYCGGILPWPQISLVGVATLTSQRWEFVSNCYT